MARKKALVKFDAENEQIIISAMLRNRRARRKLVKDLSGNEFVAGRHRVIFDGIRQIAEQRLKFNLDALVVTLSGRDYGGIEYLRKVRQGYRSEIANLDFHVEKLKLDRFKFGLRKDTLAELLEAVEDPQTDLASIADLAGELISKVQREARGTAAQTISGKAAIREYDAELKRRREAPFVGFGYLELDEILTEALFPGGLTVIGARPSIGKSTFVDNLARKLAVRKVKTLLGNLETKWFVALDIMICSLLSIPYDLYVKEPERLTQEQRRRIKRAKARILANKYLTFWRPEERSLDALETELATGDYQVVILDLFENLLDNLEQSNIAVALKRLQRMAQTYDVHIIIVHQIIREAAKRRDKRPLMADLKNSGGYEEAADLILLLHRDKYYAVKTSDSENLPDVLEIWIRKQRRGKINKCIPYEFNAECGRVGEFVIDWLPWQPTPENLTEGVV